MNDCNAKAGSPGISEAALDIERPEELTAYLIAQGFLPEDDCATVRVLPGGVSNRTMLVESAARGRFVVKQALGRLRVQAEWHAAPERIHREARALEYLGDIIGGGAVPRLLFEDRERHIIAMTAVGEPHANWKQLLLTGVIDLDHARQFGELLGRIHSAPASPEFADRTHFETLRLEPYYRYSAQQAPETAPFFERLITETLATRTALVHGDYSPKNILVHAGRLVLLDYEVAHWGDPAFDIGFALTHLLSKALHVGSRRAGLLRAARTFVEAYPCGLSERAVRHTIGCMIARVVGRSPLEYLSASERETQLRIALRWMVRPPAGVMDFIEVVAEELDCR